MQSIFIWKSDKQCVSSSLMKCFIGSNWILEDYSLQKSYKIIQQTSIKNSVLSDTILINYVSIMPINWVGSDLLQVMDIPYKVIKSDDYGTLEHIGDWFRFSLNKHIDFKDHILQNEIKRIVNWLP